MVSSASGTGSVILPENIPSQLAPNKFALTNFEAFYGG